MSADGSPLDFAAVNTKDDDGATTYEHQGGGQIYLDVNTYSEQWTIQVQIQQ
jgi:outer membrane usher protein FimD/PapC